MSQKDSKADQNVSATNNKKDSLPGASKTGKTVAKSAASNPERIREDSVESEETEESEDSTSDSETDSADTSSLSTIPDTPARVVARDRFPIPDGAAVQAAVLRLESYLRETNIENNFNLLCNTLLRLTDLPYNPYPGFARRIRIYAERFHLMKQQKQNIAKHFGTKPVKKDSGFALGLHRSEFVSGSEAIVTMVDPDQLKTYQQLLQDVTPRSSTFDTADNYSIEVAAALVGPAIFHGTFYDSPLPVCVRLEYIILGSKESQAVKLFVKSVTKDILHTNSEEDHILLGVSVPVALDKEIEDTLLGPTQNDVFPHERGKLGHFEFWSCDTVLSERNKFWLSVNEAVSSKNYIYAECLFLLDPAIPLYRRGRKQYTLNFVQVSKQVDTTEKLAYYKDFPLITLHEGVFLTQNHTQAYLSLFTPKVHQTEKPMSPEHRTTTDNPGETPEETGRTSAASRLSNLTLEEWKNSPSPNQQSFPSLNQKTSASNLSTVNPYAWEVTAPIVSFWQQKIASFHAVGNFFEIVHYVLLLVHLDRTDYDEDLLVEIYRALRGTAAKFHEVIQMSRVIRELVKKLEGTTDESELVNSLVGIYRQKLQDLMDSSLHERSSDHVAIARVIRKQLEQLIDEDSAGTVSITEKTVNILLAIEAYCIPILLQLVEDTLNSCPCLESLVKKFKDAFPENTSKPEEQSKQSTKKKDSKKTSQKTTVKEDVSEDIYLHGVEEEAIIKHDHQVVSVEMCRERGTAPQVVDEEHVLLKYIVDCHLDEIWPNFLCELMSNEYMPPNPYPRLVTCLRRCAMRMDLCYEQKDKILKKILHRGARIEDPNHYIYHIPGCDAHGLQSALAVLDCAVFENVTTVVDLLIAKRLNKRKGPYKIAVCTGLSGDTVIHGTMDPYLRYIQVDQHCYIKGPDGCGEGALEVYSKLVHDHVTELYKRELSPIISIYMGYDQVVWQVDDILNKKKAFAAEFERFGSLREPIFLKIYLPMEWRLVPVVVNFKLHFINESETESEMFFPEDVTALYSSVFTDKEKASFHLQYGGIQGRDDPYNSVNVRAAVWHIDGAILVAKDTSNWLELYRLLLYRSLINQGTSVLVEVWRMLHSIAGQFEYTRSLGQSLQELLVHGIELKNRARNPPVGTDVSGSASKLENLEAMLSPMVTAYQQRVEKVCKTHSSMTARCLDEILTTKLRAITHRDQATRKLHINIQPESSLILTEIDSMLKAVQDTTAADVHVTSGEVQATLRSIEAEYTDRPESVASARLNNPAIYASHPRALVAVTP